MQSVPSFEDPDPIPPLHPAHKQSDNGINTHQKASGSLFCSDPSTMGSSRSAETYEFVIHRKGGRKPTGYKAHEATQVSFSPCYVPVSCRSLGMVALQGLYDEMGVGFHDHPARGGG